MEFIMNTRIDADHIGHSAIEDDSLTSPRQVVSEPVASDANVGKR